MRNTVILTVIAMTAAAAGSVCGCAVYEAKAVSVNQLYADKQALLARTQELERKLAAIEVQDGHAQWSVKAAQTQTPNAKAAPTPAAVDPRRIVYSANYDVVVVDVAAALEKTQALATQTGGYMHRLSNRGIVVRVPAERFGEVSAALAKLGTVTNKDVRAEDVTEQYVDLQMRLRGAKALHEKLLGLLARAASVKEALAVETELARVRTQVEQLEGQLNKLKNRVAYATISVIFTQVANAPEEIKVKLPFPWLSRLGLNWLLNF